MNGFLWAVAVATMVFAGVISYAVARRYGWAPALILPLLAVVASIGMLWQAEGASFRDGLGMAASALVFAAPTLIGALAGILIARLRKP
jgi:fructose-specific phosphotransferase system IIC component